MTSLWSRQSAVVALDCVLKWSGLMARIRRRATDHLTILMYHKVLPERLVGSYPLGNLVVPKRIFREQMRWLARRCDVRPVGEAIAALRSPGRRDRPLVAVSFDDGYRDNAEHAAPVLEEQGLRASFFVTTGFVAGMPLWFDRASVAWREGGPTVLRDVAPEGAVRSEDSWLTALKAMPALRRERILQQIRSVWQGRLRPDVFGPMSPAEIRELSEKGHEIGSHSVTHPILTRMAREERWRELVDSRERIAEWTGAAPAGFCYPDGACDDAVAEDVSRAGYSFACSTRRGANSPETDARRLRRRMVSATSTTFLGRPAAAAFEAEVAGWHDRLRGNGAVKEAGHVA